MTRREDGLNYPEIPDSCHLTRTPVKAMAGGKHDATRPVFEQELAMSEHVEMDRSCKGKRLSQMRRYRESHREEIRANQAAYRESNRDLLRMKSWLYYDPVANEEYKAEQRRKKARREQIKIVKREYYFKYRRHYFAVLRMLCQQTEPSLPEGVKLDAPKRCHNGHLCAVWPCLGCELLRGGGQN